MTSTNSQQPKFVVYRPRSDGLRMIDIMKFKEPIVDNACFDPITADHQRRDSFKEPSPFALFPLIAYEEVGKRIGHSIRFDYPFGFIGSVLGMALFEDGESGHAASLTLDGISKFKGEKDTALAIPQYDENQKPTFEILEESPYRAIVHILNEDAVCPIENFPRKDGFYLTNARFKIPQGDLLRDYDRPDARFLVRQKSSYVGLVVRGSMAPDLRFDWCDVMLAKLPCSHLGVLLYDRQPNAVEPAA